MDRRRRRARRDTRRRVRGGGDSRHDLAAPGCHCFLEDVFSPPAGADQGRAIFFRRFSGAEREDRRIPPAWSGCCGSEGRWDGYAGFEALPAVPLAADWEARRRTQMLDRMTKELSLSPTQRAGLDSVFQRTDSSLRAIRRDMQPRLKQVFETSRAEMNARLDSAQRVKLAGMKFGGPPRGWGEGRGGAPRP